MNVGRSGEVQGVVGRVWVVEMTCFFDAYSFFLKTVENSENTSLLAVNRSPDVGIW